MSKNPKHFDEKGPLRNPPSWLNTALESRAWFEAGSMALSFPLLQASARGDGHPILVLPGFLAGDFSTRPLRAFLKSRNYRPYGWGLGRNLGKNIHLKNGCSDEVIDRLHKIYHKHKRKVSIIGWSLGGIYARELARTHPEMTRSVITLGSPYKGNIKPNRTTWLFEKVSGHSSRKLEASLRKRMHTSPPVPTTSFYSHSDGITAWESCIETPDHNSENIRVVSSHCGMGHHPFVMWAITDRLAQPEGEWKKFKKRKLKHYLEGSLPLMKRYQRHR